MNNKLVIFLTILLITPYSVHGKDEKLSPSEALKKRREELEKRNKNYPIYKNADYEIKQNKLLNKKLNDRFITDGCNASPYSSSCTQGPNSRDYSNHPEALQKIAPAPAPVPVPTAPTPVEPTLDN